MTVKLLGNIVYMVNCVSVSNCKLFMSTSLFLVVQVIENPSSQKDTVMSALYSSLNKVILHCLSKPQQSLSECLGLLSILDFLQEQWDIIFATYNSNVNFLLCLMHCLLLLNARR